MKLFPPEQKHLQAGSTFAPALLAILASAGAHAEEFSFFEAKIRPVLAESCYNCHSVEAGKSKGGLLLDTREGIRKGGDTGPAVVPARPGESLLMEAIHWQDPDFGMPPENKGGKLPDEVIEDFEVWIASGAPDPREGESSKKKYDGSTAKGWWAYQPIVSPKLPETKNQTWARTDIDRFILAKLEAQGLEPGERADNDTLIRRLYIDLTGLPPGDDLSTQNLLDRLLDSRQFAERWARHWLDVARYAETSGGDMNVTFPEAWRYRDYVVDSFHQDKPFDTFIREQIAGDLLPAANDAQRAENLIATGFLAIGPKGLNGIDPKQFAVDLADEQVDAVSTAFLGMTISCARCHDHKFDPISQKDYTSIAGIFLSTDTRYGTAGGVRERNASTLISAPELAELLTVDRSMDSAEWQRKNAQLKSLEAERDQALASRRPGRENSQGPQMTGFEVVRIITQAKRIETELSAFYPDGSLKPKIMGVVDKPTVAPARQNRRMGGPNASRRSSSGFETVSDSPLFIRGSIDNEGERIPRGIPEILEHSGPLSIPEETSGRLQLANWVAAPNNFLTARVAVNRVWHWLFGRGLVETVDNFGASGTAPSHPELLDYLALQFMEDGWSIKTLIRRIVSSSVYQLDSRHHEANALIDPDNSLFWRANAKRLDAETIRDSLLSASGLLRLEAPIGSPIALVGDGPVGGDRFQILKEDDIETANGHFRSLYLPIARTVQPEVLSVFDFKDPSAVQGQRETTIVPPQALFLMNHEFVAQAARATATRVMQEPTFEARFALACRLILARQSFPEEVSAARKFDPDDLEGWAGICRALFSSADFLFLN